MLLWIYPIALNWIAHVMMKTKKEVHVYVWQTQFIDHCTNSLCFTKFASFGKKKSFTTPQWLWCICYLIQIMKAFWVILMTQYANIEVHSLAIVISICSITGNHCNSSCHLITPITCRVLLPVTQSKPITVTRPVSLFNQSHSEYQFLSLNLSQSL